MALTEEMAVAQRRRFMARRSYPLRVFVYNEEAQVVLDQIVGITLAEIETIEAETFGSGQEREL